MLVLLYCFFCFKQKTAYEMRISDWSSDVCSSDLIHISARKCTAARHGLVPGIAAAKIELQPRRHQIGQVDAHLPEHGHIPVLVEGSRVGIGIDTKHVGHEGGIVRT